MRKKKISNLYLPMHMRHINLLEPAPGVFGIILNNQYLIS